jgi:hypothetical protein
MKISIVFYTLFSSVLGAAFNRSDIVDSPSPKQWLPSWLQNPRKPNAIEAKPSTSSITPNIIPDFGTKSIWQPVVASKFQIILYKGGDRFSRSQNLAPDDADIFDLDLFDTPKSTIQKLHSKGKRVICYFSAGSAENWRTDFSKFQAKDKGDHLSGWQREQWLDIRSPDVFEIMKSRMQLGAEKGCDGVDADNVGVLFSF